MFDCTEIFYNPTRKHTNNGTLSPVDYEIKQQRMNDAGVQETRGTSIRQSGGAWNGPLDNLTLVDVSYYSLNLFEDDAVLVAKECRREAAQPKSHSRTLLQTLSGPFKQVHFVPLRISKCGPAQSVETFDVLWVRHVDPDLA